MPRLWLAHAFTSGVAARSRALALCFIVALFSLVVGAPAFAAAPGAPSGLTATPGNGQVSLSWAAGTSATSYNVYRGITAGGESATAILTGNTTRTYVNTGLTNGTKYYFTVKSVSSGGTSGASNEANATPVLPAPTGVTATVVTTTIKISWSTVTNATSYSVYRGTTAGQELATALGTSTTSSYTDSTPAVGTKYFYTVKAVSSTNTSVASSEVNAVVPLNAPSGASATVVGTTIQISWSNSTNATSYNVYRGTSIGGESSTALGSSATTPYIDSSTLTSGQTYYYTVKAVNTVSTSLASSEVHAVAPLTAPGGVTAVVSGAALKITWSAVTNATSYSLFRATTAGGETAPALSASAVSPYTDSTVSPGTKYFYTVKAVGAAGTSPASTEVNAVAPLIPPTGVAATAGALQVTLTWTGASVNAASYNVYRGTTASGESTTALGSTTASPYLDTSTTLSGGTKYYYTVKAVNPLSTSGASSEVFATPTLSSPTGLTATPGGAKVTLAWNTVQSATNYVLQRSITSGSGFTTLVTQAGHTYTDSTAANGTTYYYVVAATNAAGQGPNSAQVSATPVPVPAAPVNQGCNWGQSNVTEYWTASTYATSYNVYRGVTSNGENSTPIATGVTAVSYLDGGLPNDGSTYYYKIKALNASGTSGYSNEGSGVPSIMASANPTGPLIMGSDGCLYGGTTAGGPTIPGNGTIFKFNPSTGASLLLHGFSQTTTGITGTNADGAQPQCGVIQALDGNFYGTALTGGPYGYGTIFEVTSQGVFTNVYSFQNNGDGVSPWGGLTQASDGTFYGTTSSWAATANGVPYGSVYTFANSTVSTVHAFTFGDGKRPVSNLIFGPDGNLYGTTYWGGDTTDNPPNGAGVAFSLTLAGGLSDLYVPALETQSPSSPLCYQPGSGNPGTYYGVTRTGGSGGAGELYSVIPGNAPSIHQFQISSGTPNTPSGPLVVMADGTVYGTSERGGVSNKGTVWKYDPTSQAVTVLHSFTGRIAGDALDSDGDNPQSGLLLASDGFMYGSTFLGGSIGVGALFRISPSGNYSLLWSLDSPCQSPGNFGIVVNSSTCVTLTWNAVPGADHYDIKRSNSNGSFTTIATTTGTTYQDCSLTPGQTYYYEVCAVINGVESPPTIVLSTTPGTAPVGPNPLVATAGSLQVALSWAPVNGATIYSLYRSLISGGPYSKVSDINAPATTLTDSGLTNGTTYYYVVNATTSAGVTQYSNQAYATPSVPGPANLVATPGNAQVSLTWGAITPLTNYKVKRSIYLNGPWNVIASPTATSYVDSTVTNGSTYYYTVSAVNASGETANSNVASAKPAYPPNAPTYLNSTAGNATVQLAWVYVPDATAYNVKRSPTQGGPYSTVATTLVTPFFTANIYVDNTVVNDTSYYYVVTALTAGGESGNSNEVSATPEAPPPTPTYLTATPDDQKVNLTWTAAPTASGYNIKRSTTQGGPYTTVDSITPANAATGTILSTDIAQLVDGTKYYYVVTATNVGGESPNSNEASTTPSLPLPSIPTGVIGVSGAGIAYLSWEHAKYAHSYNILRSATSGGPYGAIGTSHNTGFTDTTATVNTTYYYVVQSVNATGASQNSQEISVPVKNTNMSATNVVQIATTFCQTLNEPMGPAGVATFPAPSTLSGIFAGEIRPKWLVTFGDTLTGAKVEVCDTNGEVCFYYNYGLAHQVRNTPYGGSDLPSSSALTIAQSVVQASQQTESLAAGNTILYNSASATEAGHSWLVEYPRLFENVPYNSQYANTLMTSDTGLVFAFALNYNSLPPVSAVYSITSSQALTIANSQLAAAGFTGVTETGVTEEIVVPNNFWQNYTVTPSSTYGDAAWDCAFQEPDPNIAGATDTFDVYVDGSSGAVVGGATRQYSHGRKLSKVTTDSHGKGGSK